MQKHIIGTFVRERRGIIGFRNRKFLGNLNNSELLKDV
jgi:hypothetical protein